MKNYFVPLISAVISIGLTSSSFRGSTLSANVFGTGVYRAGAGANPTNPYSPDVNVGTIDGFKLEGMLMALLGQGVSSKTIPDGSSVYRIIHPEDYQTYLEIRFTNGSRSIPNAQWNVTGRAPYFTAKLNLKGVSMPIQSQRRLEQVTLSLLSYFKQGVNTTQALNELIQYDLGAQMNESYDRLSGTPIVSQQQNVTNAMPFTITIGANNTILSSREASMEAARDYAMSADRFSIDNLRISDKSSVNNSRSSLMSG